MSEGELTIKFLKKHILKTDKKWQINLESGYRWYPNQFSQDVELIKKEEEFIRIKTNVLEDIELNDQNLQIIADLLFTATMSGLAYEDGKLTLYSQLKITENSFQWMPQLLGQISLLQIAEATYSISKIARTMGAKAPYKEHPISGPRLLIDNFIERGIFYLIEVGKEPSRWEKQEFDDFKNHIKPPARLINAGPKSFDIELPFGPYASVCKISSQTRHPRIGNGLAIIQSFPMEGIPEADGIKLSLKLNKTDLDLMSYEYDFGSYCYKNGLFSHISFLPSNSHSPNLIPKFYNTCIERSKRLSEMFTSGSSK